MSTIQSPLGFATLDKAAALALATSRSRLGIATAWSLYPDSCFSDYYGRYLLYKKAHFEVAKPKVAIYVLTEVRQGGCGR